MALTKNQLSNVCLLGVGYKQCRYLSLSKKDSTVWCCLKKSMHASNLDKEVEAKLKDLADKKIDYKKQGVPVGDNCHGYIILKNIPQGYDVKS